MRHTRALAVTTLALVSVVLPVSAYADPAAEGPEAPVFTPSEASAQLEQAVAALSGEAPQADPTGELRDLALALPALSGAERRTAKGVLARPPSGEQGGPDISLGATWTPAATASRECYRAPSSEFRVHYVTSPSGGDQPPAADVEAPMGVPDYVQAVAERADTSWAVQNDDLGWPESKPDGAKGDASVTPIA